MQAWRFWRGQDLATRRRGGEKETSEEHMLSFYRGMCPCAERVCVRVAHSDRSSLAGPRASSRTSGTWFFPAGSCGVFFAGQKEMTMAMSRQNQSVAVFYNKQEQFEGETYYFLTSSYNWFNTPVTRNTHFFLPGKKSLGTNLFG